MERMHSSLSSVGRNQRANEQAFWLNKFGEDFKKTTIPYNYLNSALVERDKCIRFNISSDISNRIQNLGNDSEPRMLVILTSCLVVLLSELNQNRNIITLGMPVYKDDKGYIPTNSVIPLIVNLDETRTFKSLLNYIKNDIIAGIENYPYPITLIPNLLNLNYEQNESFPIFDIAIAFEGIQDKQYLENFKFNVLFNFSRVQNIFEVEIEYNSSLYEDDSINQIKEIYLTILDGLLYDLDKELKTLDIIPINQKDKVLSLFNNTKLSFIEDSSISEIFKNQVEKTPNRIALVMNDVCITYKVLDEKSDRLSIILRAKGIKNDTLVGLMCDRSIELFIGILGILKAGGGYLAIDSNTPKNRVKYIIKDSSINLMIGHSKYIQTIEEDIETIDITEFVNGLFENAQNDTSYSKNNIAYVLYTSGTSGLPKGVITEHKNVIAYCNAFLEVFNFNNQDIILQQASYSFDTFTEEVFPMLFSGGKIVIADFDMVRDMPRLADYIIKNSISIIDSTPLLINEIGKRLTSKGNLRTIISGGDVLKGEYLNGFSNGIVCYNTYGPTETTVCATFYKCLHKITGDAPIGNPISNYKVLIMNDNLRLVPIGYNGEICIAGNGVARGYLNKVELTTEKFIANPYCATERIYKSGDVGKYCNDGNILFSGRKDNQLSIRGYRIELREIENQILKHPEISNAVVVPIEKDDEKWICAYVVSDIPNIENKLKEDLKASLPDYMIPSFVLKIKEIPVNSNGKLSIKSLPNPFDNFAGTIHYINNVALELVKENTHKLNIIKKNNSLLHTKSNEVSKDERDKLLFEFNNTFHEIDNQKHLIELYEEQVERTPDRIALVFKDENITYRQLNGYANSLAFKLRDNGVLPNTIVGLLTQRSLNMIIGLLGILKSGAAFMPLEEEAPDDRLKYVISNTGIDYILVDERYSTKDLNCKILNLSKFNFSDYPDQKLDIKRSYNDLTHVLHTSGSTGRPKGVLIDNHSVINLFNYVGDLLKLDETINVLSLTPVTFDVFSAETLLPLTKGAKVNIIDSDVSLDIKQILKKIKNEHILFFQCSPTGLLKLISDNELNSCLERVKYIISAGEPLLESIKEKFSGVTNTELFNLYGPTETTLYSTGKNVSGEKTLNIGHPIYNTEIRILDGLENLVPIANEGEIYIGGQGVARGYVNQPEMTHEFFKTIDDKKFYKTGDLGKWLTDGDIDFIGRIDNQVQLGGVRVEPSEIENIILDYPDVKEVAVVAKENSEDIKYLMACIVAAKRLNESDIRRFLTDKLPLYLIPRKMIQLESMPYTSSKKIHRKLLRNLDISNENCADFNKPETEIESILVQIWSELLNIPKEYIDIKNNFFSMGGHSLKAIALVSRIQSEFDLEISLREVFDHSTIKELTVIIEDLKLSETEKASNAIEYENIRI